MTRNPDDARRGPATLRTDNDLGENEQQQDADAIPRRGEPVTERPHADEELKKTYKENLRGAYL
jgi:hypothetical protein